MNNDWPNWWADEPLRQFVQTSGVDLAIVMRPTGQVVAQHGFTQALDVMTASALAAAIHSASAELGRLVDDGQPFVNLYQAGESRRLFLGRCDTPRDSLLLLAIFGESSSIGLVQLFFEDFRRAILNAVQQTPPALPILEEDFERELIRSLDALFAPRIRQHRREG